MIYLFDRFISWLDSLFMDAEDPEFCDVLPGQDPEMYDVTIHKRDTEGSLTKQRRWYGKDE